MNELLLRYRRELGMLLLLIVLVTFTAVMTITDAGTSKFLRADNMTNVLRLVGMYGIFSIGVGLVIITAGIDLSIGSLVALLGAAFFLMIDTDRKTAAPGMHTALLMLGVFLILTACVIGMLHLRRQKIRNLSITLLTVLGMTLFLVGFVNIILHKQYIPWPAALGIILGLGLVFGVFHGFCIARINMQPFIVTLCGLLMYRGLARVATNDESVSVDASQFPFLHALAEYTFLGIPTPFWVLTVVAIIMYFVLQRSVFGRYIYAVGRNELATRYSGINTVKVIGATYVISGFLVGISAVMFAMFTSNVSSSVHGNFYELWGIAAAVLGGCSLRGGEGTIIGVIIGTAILQVLSNMVNLLGLPSALDYVIIGAVIFLGVLVDQIGGQTLEAVKRWFKSDSTLA